MEYNIGDKFVVVGNSGGIHFFKLGDVVTYNGADFGERRSFKRDRLIQGLPLRDVVPYYDLDKIEFKYDVAVLPGMLGYSFQWDHTPEGRDYWWDQEDNGITPEGQEKLDAMIKQYEVLHQVIGAPTEEVVDVEDWLSDDYLVEVPNSKLQAMYDTYKSVSVPDGGPQAYYDLPPDAVTLNDLIEFKSYNQWLGDTAHLFNIFKAAWRWGIKEGTSKEYDARKFIYSGARLLMHYAGVEATRETLQKMLDDKQFGGK